jgi:hypothetical protein
MPRTHVRTYAYAHAAITQYTHYAYARTRTHARARTRARVRARARMDARARTHARAPDARTQHIHALTHTHARARGRAHTYTPAQLRIQPTRATMGLPIVSRVSTHCRAITEDDGYDGSTIMRANDDDDNDSSCTSDNMHDAVQ